MCVYQQHCLQEIDCPFLRLGSCERPFCQYKHVKDGKRTFVTSQNSPSTTIGFGNHRFNPGNGALHNKDESTSCLLELERINKQIETVKSEMEKEQRKLSRYQSAQVDCVGSCSENILIPDIDILGKDQNGNNLTTSHTSTIAYSPVRKYVVDRSRPRTDLEYDPCSNFSADLRSSSSTAYNLRTCEEEICTDQGMSRAREHICGGQTPPPSYDLDYSSDEGALVIDIPPLENDKRQRSSKPSKSMAKELLVSPEGALLIDIPPQEHGQRRHWLPKQCKTSTKELVEFPEGDLLIEVPPLENDQKRDGPPQECKITKSEVLKCPDGALVIDCTAFENDHKRQSIPKQCKSATKELEFPEVDHVIDIPPLENDRKRHRPPEQCKITTKESPERTLVIDIPPVEEQKRKKPSNQRETTTKELLESPEDAKRISPKADVSILAPFCESVMPTSAKNDNLEDDEHLPSVPVQHGRDNAQSIENVLDDISICLDNLRSESEKISCLEVEPILVNNGGIDLERSEVETGFLAQHNELYVPDASLGRAQSEMLQNASSCVQKAAMSPRQVPQALVSSLTLREYFPSVMSSSFTNKTEGHGPAQQALNLVDTWPPTQKVQVEPHPQKMVARMSGLDFAEVRGLPSIHLPDQVAISPGITKFQFLQKPSTSDESHVTYELEYPSTILAQPTVGVLNNQVAEMDTDSEEELNYSDLELSDTDPMEECYHIFMEANKGEDPAVEGGIPVEVSAMPEVKKKSNRLPGQRKRVAHVSKFEANKTKRHGFVPLREPGSQLQNPSRIQQCQKRASVLTAAVKGFQSFLPVGGPRKVLAASVPHHAPHPSPVQNTCVNIIPIGTALQLGTNLHFIVQEGNRALPITIIPSTVALPQPPQVQSRPPQLRPPQPPQAPPPPPQPANFMPARPISMKRKAKVRPEVGAKVPHDIRQRYVNLFVEEFLKSSATVQDAFEKALAEEKTVYDRSINKLKYLSVAVNALKRLKNQSAVSIKGDATLYEQLKEHILSEEMLKENNYPLKHPDKAGFAIQHGDVKKAMTDPLKRICCRCGATFSVSQTGKHTRKEECNYHYGKAVENKVPGGLEKRYSCCEGALGTPGCQVFKLHVHDAVSLQGFVTTLPRATAGRACPGVYAIDCEMCYTTQGLELARVTVVNSSLQVIYDTFVKPDNDVIDYNTRFSGVSEDDVEGTSLSLSDIQAVLLSFISADTVLIGHGLENDLCALKLLHSTVIDTSVVFPHRLGRPHKRDLYSLTGDYLRRIVQESVEGHDSGDDAAACMELMFWRVKEDAKVKRW